MPLTVWFQNHWRAAPWAKALGVLTLVALAQFATGPGGVLWLLPGALLIAIGVAGAHVAPSPAGRLLTLLLVLPAAVGSAVVYLLGSRADGYALGAGMFAVLALGEGLTIWRDSPYGAPWRGPAWLAVCFAGFLIGLSGLSSGLHRSSLIILSLSVFLAPIGVSLMSEDLLQAMPVPVAPPPSLWQRVPKKLVGIGAVLVFVPCLVLVLGAATLGLVLLAVLVVVLLLFVMTTSAQADIGLLLIAGAVLFSAGPSAQPLTASDAADPGERVAVALGDSFMSGEGAQRFYAGTNDKGVNECRRAPSAYAEVLAHSAGLLGADHVALLACSGAKASELYGAAQGVDEHTAREAEDGADPTRLNQLVHLARLEAIGPMDITLLLVSIGGNDVGFSTIGTACVAPGDCSQLRKQFFRELDALRPKLDAAYFEIAKAVNGRFPVAVVPYPIPLTREACSSVWLTASEHEFLVDFTTQLDVVVQQESAKYGFSFVAPMVNALGSGPAKKGQLRLCDHSSLSKVGVNFIGLRSVFGRTEQRLNPANWVHNSLHPNEAGHLAMASTLGHWLSSTTLTPPPKVATTAVRPLVPPAQVLRPCDVARVDPEGCDTNISRWTAAQVTDLVWANLVAVLAILLGCWLWSVAIVRVWRVSHP